MYDLEYEKNMARKELLEHYDRSVWVLDDLTKKVEEAGRKEEFADVLEKLKTDLKELKIEHDNSFQ